jgi:hypothetical protein
MRLRRWIGHNAIRAVIAVQFGTAMMPLCSAMRPALISGITSGTSGSIRKADELSTTTAPAFTAMGENFLEMPPPAENSAISTPSNEVSESSSMRTFCPRKSMVLPAERALASALSLPTRKARLSMVAMNSAPTAPVTPAMATTGSFFTSALHRAIKKPRTFSGGASVQMMRSSGYARTPPEAPEGFAVLLVRLVVVIMSGTLWGRLRPASTAFGPKIDLNKVELDLVVTQ